LHDNFQRESHKPYGPPTSATWLQLLRQQTGTSAALTAEMHWSTHARHCPNSGFHREVMRNCSFLGCYKSTTTPCVTTQKITVLKTKSTLPISA